MSEDVIRIEQLENGFEVECIDPKIQAKNAEPKSMWQDPYKSYAFSTKEEVIAFVSEKLGKMKPRSPDGGYAAAFKEAASKS